MRIVHLIFPFIGVTFVSLASAANDKYCATISNMAERLKCHAQIRGLPDTATWRDINRLDNEQARMRAARISGLPETASWKDISRISDEMLRQQNAKNRGLPDTASWQDIDKFDNDKKHASNQSSQETATRTQTNSENQWPINTALSLTRKSPETSQLVGLFFF